MITLGLPATDGGWYASVFNVLVGPLSPTSLEPEVIPFTPNNDALLQDTGIYGEKGVRHYKEEGHVSFVPHFRSMRDAPDANFPLQKLIDVFYASSPTAKSVITLPYGDLSTSEYGYAEIGSSFDHYYFEGIVPHAYRVWNILAMKSDPRRVMLSHVEVKNLRIENDRIAYAYRSVTYTLPSLTTSIYGPNVEDSWAKPRSAEAFRKVIARGTPYDLNSAFWNATATPYILKNTGVSPSTMKSDILMRLVDEWTKDSTPLEFIHYGDLAMQATAKVNANDVNMFAFLRDLRKPWELVPKLRNLRNLKTWADNFLTVEYGILPTIDDIKSIVTALRGVKPYLDRNGFKVVTAKYVNSKTVSNTTYSLEQRIKVAVDNEDAGLLALANKLDSMGFLLTLENVWDLIPYSFVIDWFLDIGSLLERADANLRILRLGVRYATFSWKRTATVKLQPTPNFPYSGTISTVQYHRWVTDHCPEPPLSLPEVPSDFNHWLEATALLVQRKKN